VVSRIRGRRTCSRVDLAALDGAASISGHVSHRRVNLHGGPLPVPLVRQHSKCGSFPIAWSLSRPTSRNACAPAPLLFHVGRRSAFLSHVSAATRDSSCFKTRPLAERRLLLGSRRRCDVLAQEKKKTATAQKIINHGADKKSISRAGTDCPDLIRIDATWLPGCRRSPVGSCAAPLAPATGRRLPPRSPRFDCVSLSVPSLSTPARWSCRVATRPGASVARPGRLWFARPLYTALVGRTHIAMTAALIRLRLL